ncbi:MAG: lysophospholipid acyltransferase family protein [bacterium]
MKSDSRKTSLTWLMPLGTLIQFILPRFLAVQIALLAGKIAFRINSRQRLRLLENYRHILGSGAPEKLLDQTARQAFENMAVFYADLLRIPVIKKRVAFIGEFDRKEFDQILSRGKSVILVTGHIGNWDLAGVFLTALGYPLSAVVELVPGGWTRTFNRYRKTLAMETIPIPERHKLIRALKKHRVVVLVADRDITNRGILCPAFDAQRSFPKGPAVYSLRYKIPIVIGYFVRQRKRNRPPYVGVISRPIEFKPTGDINFDITSLTQIIAQKLNQIIKKYPDQWLVFNAGWQ